MSNYLIYPMKTMRITQNYNGATSHRPHTTGTPKDYPIDEGGANIGRDWLYCPCDEMRIKRIYGVGSSGTNTLWIESTSKVTFADGTSGIFSMQITHPNDDDLKSLKVGQKFKRGEKICREGKDGATGNHLHLSGGKGTITNNGWVKNSNGKFVLTTAGGAFKPEALFFIDENFTTVKSSNGITFKKLEGSDDMTRGYFKKGDKNEGVLALKQLLITLKNLGVITQSVDNNESFGDGTVNAVKQLQKAAGIAQDGCAGQITIKAATDLIKSKSATTAQVTALEAKIKKAKEALA